jgi:hypothetical protein
MENDHVYGIIDDETELNYELDQYGNSDDL